MTTSYKDFVKGSKKKKLFEDEYNKETFSFKIKSKVNKDLDYEVTGKTKGEFLDSSFKWTESKPFGEDFKCKGSGTVFSNGNLEFSKEISKNKSYFATLKGSINGSGTDKELLAEEEKEDREFRDSIGGEFKILQEKFQGTLEITQKRKNPLKTTGQLSIDCHHNLKMGANVIFRGSKLSNYNFGFLYNKNDFSVFTNIEDSLKKVKVSVSHNLNSKLSAGIEFTHLNKDSKDSPNTLATAFRYDNSNDSFFKGKICSQSKDFSLSYGTRVAPGLNAILTVDSDLNDLKSKGLKLSLEYSNE